MQARPSPGRYRLTWILNASILVAVSSAGLKAANDPFAENIRNTDPLPPSSEQKALHVPPGFEVQLVAAEPDIGKVMNMAFDTRGRLWITVSRQYPFPAATNQAGQDAVKILSDFGPDGRAHRIESYAEGLNIPIGLLPYRDGVIAFSIPYIYYFADTNGDDRADTKEILLGRFGFERDTHGLTGSFRRGYDGWIYADHGFNNNTTLTARDGSTISMNSGNTYRFRADGSRVEQNTWGQVNPFGLMFDALGDLWSADCHSSPVYQLLRGAYYPSFGKPHDGLGFGPDICAHTHGSTAIAGMVFYAATNFPPEYRGNTFVGNVMTCRINRDSFAEHGSTRIAKEEPDFLRSDDPWFRPVDLQLGPDGAIYVADFYNRIIGHYEVPLDHPGRDRERGRIWRIVYVGEASGESSPTHLQSIPFDLSRSLVTDLVKELANSNLARRMLAMNELGDRLGRYAIQPVEHMLEDSSAAAEQKAHGLWVLHRLNALRSELLLAAAQDPNRLLRVHAQRVLSETPDWSSAERQQAIAGLRDADAYVQRAAADALGTHPHREHVRPLLDVRRRAAADDSHLLHTVRMALRNQLRVPGAIEQLDFTSLTEADSRALADVALGIQSAGAGSLVLNHVQKYATSHAELITDLRHVARFATDRELDALVDLARTKFADDLGLQFTFFKTVQDGLAQRGAKPSAGVRSWAARLAEQLLSPPNSTNTPWANFPLPDATESPWFLQKRTSADGDQASVFLCSLPPNGESLTGVLRSRPFAIPPKLTFYLAGHDGFPNQPAGHKNLIRLRVAGATQVLISTLPPRNDIAQKITWDLGAWKGQEAVLEIVDGDTGSAYAWLAAGRFDPAVVPMPAGNPNNHNQGPLNAADLARTVPLPELASRFAAILNDAAEDRDLRAAAAQTLLSLAAPEYVPSIAGILTDTNQPSGLRERLALLLADQAAPMARNAVLDVLRLAPQRLQIKLAQALAMTVSGAQALMKQVEERKLPPQVIVDRVVKERLVAASLPRFSEQYEILTRGVAPASEELLKLLKERRAGYELASVSAVRGQAVFEKTCAVCHQLKGKGAVVGPQLDGVGHRGLERLIEDVLDPNRNVDPSFHATNLTLKNDTALTGLFRREEGEVLVFADTTGKEIAIPKNDIAERRESELSLMPSNFADVLSVPEFYDLMAHLLTEGSK